MHNDSDDSENQTQNGTPPLYLDTPVPSETDERKLTQKLQELRLPHFLPQLPTILSLLLLAAALPTMLYLTQQPQDTRQFAQEPTPTPLISPLLTLQDLTQHLGLINTSASYDIKYDLDRNNVINQDDIAIFNAQYCSPAGNGTIIKQNFPTLKDILDNVGKPNPFLDLDTNGIVDQTDIAIFKQKVCNLIPTTNTPQSQSPVY